MVSLTFPIDVLVATRRVVPRFSALTPHEVSDLFTSVHRIAPVVEKLFNATSLTIAIQVKYSSSCSSVDVCMICYWSHALISL